MDLMGIVSGLGSSALDLIGAGIGTQMSKRASRSLRQTAYQDTVKDLKAAGLNPMLAFGNGPSSSPGVNNPVGQLGGNLESGTRQEVNRQQAILQSMQEVMMDAQTDAASAQAGYYRAQTRTENENTESARLRNVLAKAYLTAEKNKGNIKSGSPWLQWLDVASETVGKILGNGNSALDLMRK